MATMSDIGMQREKRHEGKITAHLEARTARVPSGAYLGLAVGSMVASAVFQLVGKKETAQFIGQWVPSLLVIGLYNKLVKIEQELVESVEQRPQSSYTGV